MCVKMKRKKKQLEQVKLHHETLARYTRTFCALSVRCRLFWLSLRPYIQHHAVALLELFELCSTSFFVYALGFAKNAS